MNIQFTLSQTLLALYKNKVTPTQAANIIDSMCYDLTMQEWQLEMFKQYQQAEAGINTETATWMMQLALAIVKVYES